LIAAMSVSGPAVRMSQNLPAIKTAVREAVQTISILLGAPETEPEVRASLPAPTAGS